MTSKCPSRMYFQGGKDKIFVLTSTSTKKGKSKGNEVPPRWGSPQAPRLRAVLQTAASSHDCNPHLIFISPESATPCLGGPGKGSLAAVNASGDDCGKPLYPPSAARLCGHGLEIYAGSGLWEVKKWWVVPRSCPIEVRHSVRTDQPRITASLNRFQVLRRRRPFELRGRGRGRGFRCSWCWELRQSSGRRSVKDSGRSQSANRLPPGASSSATG